jgi:hypothetical protein
VVFPLKNIEALQQCRRRYCRAALFCLSLQPISLTKVSARNMHQQQIGCSISVTDLPGKISANINNQIIITVNFELFFSLQYQATNQFAELEINLAIQLFSIHGRMLQLKILPLKQ